VLELDVIAYLVNLVPAICIESLDDFSTVHRSIIHIGAYYAKKNTEVVWKPGETIKTPNAKAE
jgi:hypothetical protein